jgi:OOP family OmpA-OmpF porin
MAYYRYINGKQLDQELLALAETLTEGRGDGRIALADIEQLIQASLDGGTITQVEKDTLEYIYETFRWTDIAKSFYDAEFPRKRISLENDIVKIIRTDFGLARLKIKIDPIEAKRQTLAYKNEVSFQEALSIALTSFLEEEDNATSLRQTLMNMHQLAGSKTKETKALLKAILKDQLNDATLVLIPSYQNLGEDQLLDFEPPSGKEASKDYWIFGLQVYDLVGHYFWAIVDRSNTFNHYNYGLN